MPTHGENAGGLPLQRRTQALYLRECVDHLLSCDWAITRGGEMRRRSDLAAARRAAGYTQEGLAEALHVDRTTVIRWEAGENAPLPYIRPKLGRLLGRSADQLRAIIDVAEPALNWPDLDAAMMWLDERAGWGRGSSAAKVADRLAAANRSRPAVGRSRIADALGRYYGTSEIFRVPVDGHDVLTSIATRAEWTDLRVPLTAAAERTTLVAPASGWVLGDVAVKAAVQRLADAAARDVRISNAPIYRLMSSEIGECITAEYAVVPFAEYALTMDLLEGELVDAIGASRAEFPLRDKYLPDMASVFDLGGRLCAGGVPALCAIARSADAERGPADFMILVQERSENVLNAARRLAVIPKGFHGPLSDYRADARIGSTLRRELEEELFGRADVDSTIGTPNVAEPMHPTRLSEPMRWLADDGERMRLECTAFGFNLVSGNYEFASLVLIQDEEFWPRYGGHVEANWEVSRLRRYSTLDREMLADLIMDESWSNEGLFALIQGLRRLREIDPMRVDLPSGL
ncbi:helix-turn-helix transcriptional regulator [Alloactinosynnema sp. L-07]|uniref:helix-turn-helix transcriptional regulator n=1 Tax=Alloactinosynnema sp. L-07 TaxID=1653480 RepID=UPI001E479C9E|nr:helix-turn-helix transcriptional regulator [Alloactinosynnema sp. L-07]